MVAGNGATFVFLINKVRVGITKKKKKISLSLKGKLPAGKTEEPSRFGRPRGRHRRYGNDINWVVRLLMLTQTLKRGSDLVRVDFCSGKFPGSLGMSFVTPQFWDAC